MPGRNGYAVSGGWANSTMKVNNQTFPADLTIDMRDVTISEYVAGNSVTLQSEFEDKGSEEYNIYIADGTTTSSSMGGSGTGGGSTTAVSVYRYGFNGQEKDVDNGNDIYTAQFWEYDSRIGRRWNLDPKPTTGFSEYTVFSNNPISLTDPLGDTTNFVDKNNNLVKHVEDGSNAVFKQTGSGTDLHYELNGYDKTQKGKDNVNLTSAIQEQQNLNMQNPALQENAQGQGETHCNQSVQCVMKTVASATGNPGVLVTGDASTMTHTLENGKNPNYKQVTEQEAADNAKKGGLSVVGHVDAPHGHVLTYSVGENITKGAVANIGQKKFTGYKSLNWSIAKSRPKSFYILIIPSAQK